MTYLQLISDDAEKAAEGASDGGRPKSALRSFHDSVKKRMGL